MNRNVIDIDLSNQRVSTEPLAEQYRHLGGRALTSSMIASGVEPLCHPLSAENMLVIAPGLLAGTALSSANRLSAGAKSPLTGTIKESNSGGMTAFRLGRMGIAAVRIHGKLDAGRGLAGIRISKDGVSFEDLSSLKGKGAYEAAAALLERYGRRVGLILIGPAGELKLSTAGMSVNDPEGEPCRNLARGGLGAVMGSKGIKAIIVDDAGTEPAVADKDRLKEVISRYTTMLKEHPVTGERFAKYGTSVNVTGISSMGGLPTRNFSDGVFEGAEKIGAETLYKNITSRGGAHAHACMPGCVIRCSNKYVDAAGEAVVGSLDYETLCLLGSNLGLSDLDQVAELNRLCNDIGIDTMETGAALGVLADGGVFAFGDYLRIKQLVEQIGTDSPMGRLLGSGSGACGKAYGVERVPVVKNQGMAAYDPRTIKGLGLTYAQSTMGADHTAGNAIVLDVDHSDPTVQLEPVRNLNIQTMVLDWMGLCLFTARVTLNQTEIIEQMVEAVTGRKVGFGELMETAWELLLLERDFNRRAGFTQTDDRLPRFMLTEPLPPHGMVADLSEETIDRFYDR